VTVAFARRGMTMPPDAWLDNLKGKIRLGVREMA
jgi:hypothetical protein